MVGMRKKIIIVILLVALTALAIFGLSQIKRASPTETGLHKLTIVTTLFPTYDWTRNIVGDDATVNLLLSGGAGAHDASLTPQAVKQLADADVLIMNGAGLETFLDVEQLQLDHPDLTVIKMQDAVPNLLRVDESGQANTLSDVNPHIWLSPNLAMAQVRLIMATLQALDPGQHAIQYATNGAAYIQQLEQLNEDYAQTTAQFSQRKFISFHDAMPYVARDYNLQQVAVIEDFPGESPSPDDIISLHNLITAQNVKTIFTEPQFSPSVAETIAADTGAHLAIFDTLEVEDIEKDTYISKMRENLANMLTAMR